MFADGSQTSRKQCNPLGSPDTKIINLLQNLQKSRGCWRHRPKEELHVGRKQMKTRRNACTKYVLREVHSQNFFTCASDLETKRSVLIILRKSGGKKSVYPRTKAKPFSWHCDHDGSEVTVPPSGPKHKAASRLNTEKLAVCPRLRSARRHEARTLNNSPSPAASW